MIPFRFILFGLLISSISCKPGPAEVTYKKITGLTMGTYYQVTCTTNDAQSIKTQIESLLQEVNDGMNHYLPNSLITQFNNSENGETFNFSEIEARHFYKNIEASQQVVKETSNHFDPTVGPLVNYWKFGPDGKYNLTTIDSTKVDSLMEIVGFNRITLNKKDTVFSIDKSDPRVALDFSAIAKGYGVDAIAELLESKGIKNYYIDIGGENRVAGMNNKDIPWVLAINTPKEDAGIKDWSKVISITDKAIATSGNYRNVYEIDGIKVSHTINPFTGYPERSNLLSATIIHDECMYADAYATACMVMGLEKAQQFVNTHPEVSYLFLYSDVDGEIQSVDSGDIEFL